MFSCGCGCFIASTVLSVCVWWFITFRSCVWSCCRAVYGYSLSAWWNIHQSPVTSTTANTTQTSITSITPTYTTRITLTTTTATTMRPSSFLTTSIVVLVVVVLQEAAAAPRCNRQGTRTPSLNCKYGTVADWCGNRVCAKGPGETCGGDWGEKGACVAGTYCSCGFCSCGYCTGCAANLDCWFGHFC
ncbi:neuroparsin-A isoform X1 [Cherax quadricarinatus]